jgi:cytochrome c553
MKQRIIILLAAVLTACQTASNESASLRSELINLKTKQSALEKTQYVPHLGWAMVQVQVYHAKLYFAGAAKNWDLAAYYVQELEEALEDVEKHHPEHEGVKIAELVKAMALPQVEKVEETVEQKDAVAFSAAFEKLTTSCNQCHQAVGKSIIRIKVPQNTGLPNQDFNP